MSNNHVQIFWDIDTSLYRVRTPYDKNFVDEFKGMIPWQERGWDGATRTWGFTEAWLVQVDQLVEKHFPHCTITTTTKAEAEAEYAKFNSQVNPAESLTKLEKAAISFALNLDTKALSAAHRLRISVLHPDKGGDPALASEFNAAFQALYTHYKEKEK